MRILKKGVKPEGRLFLFLCEKCNTEYECRESECRYERILDNQGICWGEMWTYICPVCGENNTFNKRDINK